MTWLVAHTEQVNAGHEPETRIYDVRKQAYDFEAIELTPGDVLHLLTVSDTDDDGLGFRAERRYGTDPAKPDTDEDGLVRTSRFPPSARMPA